MTSKTAYLQYHQTDPTPPTLPVLPARKMPPSPPHIPASLCSCGCPHSRTRSSQSPSASGPGPRTFHLKPNHSLTRNQPVPMETGLDHSVARCDTAEVDLRESHLVCLRALLWRGLSLDPHAACRFVTSELITASLLSPLAHGTIQYHSL